VTRKSIVLLLLLLLTLSATCIIVIPLIVFQNPGPPMIAYVFFKVAIAGLCLFVMVVNPSGPPWAGGFFSYRDLNLYPTNANNEVGYDTINMTEKRMITHWLNRAFVNCQSTWFIPAYP